MEDILDADVLRGWVCRYWLITGKIFLIITVLLVGECGQDLTPILLLLFHVLSLKGWCRCKLGSDA